MALLPLFLSKHKLALGAARNCFLSA